MPDWVDDDWDRGDNWVDDDTDRELPEWLGLTLGWMLLLGLVFLLGYGAYVTFFRDDAVPSSPASVYPRTPHLQQRGPSAVCEDGTISYSTNDQGTCSWHGGVDHWLR